MHPQPHVDHQPAASFYEELTIRNRGFIAASTQQRLSTSTSWSRAAGPPEARRSTRWSGWVLSTSCSPTRRYELNNLNRQHAFLTDIGSNKARSAPSGSARLTRTRRRPCTPRDHTRERPRPRAPRHVVIDGVDVTEQAGWVAKYLLHEAAAALGRPVISGYDMAGTQYVRFYPYRPGDPAFEGRIEPRGPGHRGHLEPVPPARPDAVRAGRDARPGPGQVGSTEEAFPQLVTHHSFRGDRRTSDPHASSKDGRSTPHPDRRGRPSTHRSRPAAHRRPEAGRGPAGPSRPGREPHGGPRWLSGSRR